MGLISPGAEPVWTLWLTRVAAALGAVTGTLSLWINVRQHRRDRAALRVSVRYVVRDYSRFPPEFEIDVKVANVGRRPATPDAVLIQLLPRITAVWKRFTGTEWTPVHRFSYRDARYEGGVDWPPTLDEAKTFSFAIDSTALPKSYTVADVRRVAVRDNAGNLWTSPTAFGQRTIASYLSAESLREETFEAVSEVKSLAVGASTVSLRAFRLPEKVLLEVNGGVMQQSMGLFASEAEWEAAWMLTSNALTRHFAEAPRGQLDNLLRGHGFALAEDSVLPMLHSQMENG